MPPPDHEPLGEGTRTRRLIRLCLLAWPREARKRDGAALAQAASDHLQERRVPGGRVPLVALMAECASVLRAGLVLRVSRLSSRVAPSRSLLREGFSGWASGSRIALRALARSPAFTVAAVATLALGVGANAAVFGLVDRALFQPPPFRNPQRLVLVWSSLPGAPTHVPVAAPDAAVIRNRASVLSGVAFMNRITDGALDAREGDAAQHVRAALVTENFFRVLGATAAQGRTFLPDDAVAPEPRDPGPGAPRAVILSNGLWRRVFGADPAVLGRDIRLDGSPATVVGVMPAGFEVPVPPDAGIATDADLWVPLRVPLSAFRRADGRWVDQDSDNSGVVVARLAEGATLSQARASLRRIAAELRAEVPAYATADRGLDVRSLQRDATAHERTLLLVLLAGAAAVLLVACLNVSILLLARGARRRRELAVRMALGAGRRNLARQLMTENAVLLTLSGVAAVGVAWGGSLLLRTLLPPSLDPTEALAPDPRILVLALLLAGGLLVVSGVLPAVRAVVGPRDALAMASRLRQRHTARTRDGLIVAEVAASVVLVLGAGLLLRTVRRLHDVQPGFQPQGALTFSLSVRTPVRYRGPADRARLMRQVENRVDALPGVRAVGLVGHLPLSGRRWSQPYGLPGEPESEWAARRADFRMVTSGYFAAIGTRLLQGRTFTRDEDLNERRRVVIVDRALARRIAPDGSAVGAHIGFPLDGEAVEAEVVGVVEDVRFDALDAESGGALYVPYRQEASRDVSFVVRVGGEPAAIAPAVRSTLRELDPQLAVYGLRPLADYVSSAIAPKRFALGALAAYAVLALLAATLGLYGVVSFEVGARTREIGVRMAVGATRRVVVTSVLGRGVRLAGAGIATGALLAAPVARAFRHLLFGVGVADVATWTGVLATVFAVTLLACWIPALRASKLDAREALRAD